MTDHPSDRLRVVVTLDSRSKQREILAPGTGYGEMPKVGNCDFTLNPDGPTEADFWIVYGNARPEDEMQCAPENTLFIAAEPESKKVYPEKFYRQFHRIVDTHTRSGHPRITLHAPCLSWHVGMNRKTGCFEISHEALSAIPCPENPINKVSVVCSDANFTDGQRARLSFLDELKASLGDDVVHFGRGFSPIDDKFDVISKYRFHLVLENSQLPHYWTEKLSDSYLGWAFPLYVGSPNLSDYFPRECYEPVSMQNAGEAATKIKTLLDSPRDTTEIAAVTKGRDLILNLYNPWVAWARWAEEFANRTAEPELLKIRSHKAFRSFPRGLLFRMRTAMGR